MASAEGGLVARGVEYLVAANVVLFLLNEIQKNVANLVACECALCCRVVAY